MKKKHGVCWRAWLAAAALFLTFTVPAMAYGASEDQNTGTMVQDLLEPSVQVPPDNGNNEGENTEDSEPPVEQEPETITVTYRDGETVLLTLTLSAGEAPEEVPDEDASGEAILGWVVNGARVTNPTTVVLTENTVYTVWKQPVLNTQEHIPYVNGQGAGSFAPSKNLTRAEAVTMIASLLTNASEGNCKNNFSDVSSGDWYSTSVKDLAGFGVVGGYQDGTFQPQRTITRAEFVTILSVFYPPEEELGTGFTDVPATHWARANILSAAAKGWIGGYADGTFHPDQTITRAEAVTVLNAVLNRSAAAAETKELIRAHGICIFTDVKADDWFYAGVMEASIPHDFSAEEGEVWTDFTYRSCGYDSGFHKIGSSYYMVDENHQITFFPPGMQTMDGKLYYVAPDGSIPAEPGPREIGNALYYTNEDGSLLTNGTIGYLHFGSDGRYTSGNAEIDNYVEQLLASCTNATMSREEKLRATYVEIREYRYLSRPHQGRGTTDWAESAALWMFRNKKGNCYCYSGAFLYVAHRLGYQANVVSGGYGPKNGDHAWVMVGDRIYDPCLENVYRYRSSVVRYYDLYNILPADAPIAYYFP